ncbi:MAG TPA: PH domain-containing protein, partial [Acidimicrobiales bacterium]|nr:PH domain-containing protein [Acidimicrobiales bacterium]
MALSDKKKAQLRNDAAPVLMAGEEIIDATTGLAEVRRMGQNTRRRATVLVTDRRIVIFSKKLGGYDVQDYAYGLLTGVDHKKGLTGGHLNLRASGDSANVSNIE